jgi:hypothetical protein
MSKKMGRPRVPKKDAFGVIVSVRLRPHEAQSVSAAVRASGKTQPDWLRSVILAAVGKK